MCWPRPILAGVSLILTAFSPTLLISFAPMIIYEIGTGGFMTLNMAVIVTESDPAYFGRITSLTMLAFAGFMLAGSWRRKLSSFPSTWPPRSKELNDMDDAARTALANDLVIDITTTGRKSGEPKRIEIWIHEVEGRYYISGHPGTRGWYANLLKNPELTVHLKKSHSADLSARVTLITDPEAKRSILRPASSLNDNFSNENVDDWLARSPLLEVVFD